MSEWTSAEHPPTESGDYLIYNSYNEYDVYYYDTEYKDWYYHNWRSYGNKAPDGEDCLNSYISVVSWSTFAKYNDRVKDSKVEDKKEQTCENCKHWEKTKMKPDIGICSMLGHADMYHNVVLIDSIKKYTGSDMKFCTYNDFSCSQWEEDGYRTIAYLLTTDNNTLHFLPIKSETDEFPFMDESVKLNITRRGLPVYLPVYLSKYEHIKQI